MRRKMIIPVILSIIMTFTSLTGCGHEHISSIRDCTIDKKCDLCDKILEPASSHVPTAAATCTEDSVLVQPAL